MTERRPTGEDGENQPSAELMIPIQRCQDNGCFVQFVYVENGMVRVRRNSNSNRRSSQKGKDARPEPRIESEGKFVTDHNYTARAGNTIGVVG